MEPLSLILGIFCLVLALLVIGWYVGETFPLRGLGKELGELKPWVDKHSWLKILFAGFSLYLLLFIPKFMWDADSQVCNILLDNVTNLGVYAGSDGNGGGAGSQINHSVYSYSHHCYSTTNTAGKSVFTLYTKLLWLVGIYGLVIMIILLIQKILDWKKSL